MGRLTRLLIWANVFIMTLGVFSLGSAEDGNLEEEFKGVYISSKTRITSAACKIFELDEDEDRRREEIGIGEIVDLKLEGKLLHLVDKDKIEWEISKESEQWVTLTVNEKNKFKATLIAKKNPIVSGEVLVKVKTGAEDKPTPKKFRVLVPAGIAAINLCLRSEDGPRDGQVNEIGASTHLALSFFPRTVSFSNLDFIERSLDEPKDIPDWAAPHTPNPVPQKIDEYNGYISDLIGLYPPKEFRENSLLLFQNLPLPEFYFYRCGFYTVVDGKDCCLIGNAAYLQTYNCSYDGKRWDKLKDFRVKVFKFQCSVERSTAKTALHIDTGTGKDN